MTITLTTTEDYLRFKDDASIQLGCAAPEDWAYRTYEGMVLDLGQPFERKPLPRGFARMKEKMCYLNALSCVMKDYDGQYVYVEGYARGIIVTEHAFVLDTEDGKVFDPTWPRDDRHDGYYGIPLPTDWVWSRTLDTGIYGLLANDWMFDNYLLRNGRSAWED